MFLGIHTGRLRGRLSRAFREAAGLLAISCLLGLAYNVVQQKGAFAERNPLLLSTEVQPSSSPAFIAYDEAVALLRSRNALFIDSRTEYDYNIAHIEGAVNIPLKQFDQRWDLLASIPRDRLIVTYCDGEECNSSIELAKKLSAAGFSQIRIFFGGWKEWQTHQERTEEKH